MDIVFKNKGILSLVDITTMGDSSKRDDPGKIGEFDSGLKYAIAILYRNGIKVTILSGGKEYIFDTTTISPDHKTKEVLTVNDTPTAFSPQLGHNWKLWMAYRELYSNCIDEDGFVEFSDFEKESVLEEETAVVIHSCDFNESMRSNWHKYFINNRDCIYKDNYVKMYENDAEDKHLRLYKNGIMVYENIDARSQYLYDYSNASIDERRVLNDKNSFENKVSDLIMECKDINVISEFISGKIEKSFESNLSYYWTFSEEWVSMINNLHLETPVTHNTVYRSMFIKMMEDNRFKIGYTRVSHSSPSYSYEKATVQPVSKEEPEEESFENKIKSICSPFEIKYEIVKSNIDKFKCLPNKSKKILYVTEDFSKEDLWELVKAVFRMDGNDNPDYVYKQYVKLLI